MFFMAKVCTICYWPEDIRRVVRKVEILLAIGKTNCMCKDGGYSFLLSQKWIICVKGRGYF